MTRAACPALQVLPQYRRIPEGSGEKKSHTVRLLSNYVRERSSHAKTSLEPQPKPKSSPPLLLRRSSVCVCTSQLPSGVLGQPPNPKEAFVAPQAAAASINRREWAGRVSEAGRAPRGLGIVCQGLLLKGAHCLSEDRAEWRVAFLSIAD